MYIDAVCKGIDDIPTVDEETRRLMWERYEEVGLEQLCKGARRDAAGGKRHLSGRHHS